MAGYEETFARYYDALTADVDYRGHGAYLKSLAEQYGGRFRLVLDLACGTGSLAVSLARQGVEVIAVTRNKASTLAANASVLLSIPVTEKRVRVAAVASITSEMFWVDVLYMSLLQKDYERYEEMLVNTSRVVNLLRE